MRTPHLESRMAMRIAFNAGRAVSSAIARIGRTEDIRWSPSGRRLALAGYRTARVLILDVDVDGGGGTPRVDVTGSLEVSSSSFDHPHGVSWLDEHTLFVANRYGEVGIYELPGGRAASGQVALEAVRTFGDDRRDLMK